MVSRLIELDCIRPRRAFRYAEAAADIAAVGWVGSEGRDAPSDPQAMASAIAITEAEPW